MNFNIYLTLALLISCLAVSQENTPSKSSIIIKSIILPGWGNYSANNKEAAYYHLSIELSLWLAYSFQNNLKNSYINDYKLLARTQLGNLNYTDDLYLWISRYNSYDEYVEFQQRQGVNSAEILDRSNEWQWDNDTQRTQFAEKRFKSIQLERDLKYWIYAAGLNRIIAIFTSMSDLKNLQMATKVSFLQPQSNLKKIELNLTFNLD